VASRCTCGRPDNVEHRPAYRADRSDRSDCSAQVVTTRSGTLLRTSRPCCRSSDRSAPCSTPRDGDPVHARTAMPYAANSSAAASSKRLRVAFRVSDHARTLSTKRLVDNAPRGAFNATNRQLITWRQAWLRYSRTGSSRGLGREIVEAALAAGHQVVATARRSEQLAGPRRQIRQPGPRRRARRHGPPVQPRPRFAPLSTRFGRLDVW